MASPLPMPVEQFMLIVDTLISTDCTIPNALERTERIHLAFFGRRRYAGLAEAELAHQQYQKQHLRQR